MKDGTYQYAVEMTVPLGKRNGRLDLHICKGLVDGALTMFTRVQPIANGSCSGRWICFTGQMRTTLNTISYTAEGTITQAALKLVFYTPQGDYQAVGRPWPKAKRRQDSV